MLTNPFFKFQIFQVLMSHVNQSIYFQSNLSFSMSYFYLDQLKTIYKPEVCFHFNLYQGQTKYLLIIISSLDFKGLSLINELKLVKEIVNYKLLN